MNDEWIASYYEMGLYTAADLAYFVAAGFLTEAQKEELVTL